MESTKKRISVLRAFGVTTFLVLALAITGCATTLRGQVLDAQTGQPISGAVILGVWTKGGGVPGLAHTDLVGVREAETDGEGRFELERLTGLFVEESVTVYKFGYIGWNSEFTFPPLGRRDGTAAPTEARLTPFPPGESHREHMRFIDLAAGAGIASGSWVKFRDAIRREERMRWEN
jgi:hypothetical protein